MRSVLHPTDLSRRGETAFAHALALALLGKSRLTILNAVPEESHRRARDGFPRVREMLEGWGRLDRGSEPADVFGKLGLRVEKVAVRSDQPVGAMLQFLWEEPADLIVLATAGRDGLQRWLRPSVAEPVARRSRTMTLFLPNKAAGFVSPKTGEIRLRRILIPVDREPVPEPALDVATDLAALLGGDPIDVTLTHVGSETERPALMLPEDAGCNWRLSPRSGDVVREIVADVKSTRPDLIVMTTRGHDGFLDALRGSTTEQVLRRATCPVLAVPTS